MDNDADSSINDAAREGLNPDPALFRAILRGVFTAVFAYILLNLAWTVIDPPVSVLPETRENGYFDPMIFARILGILAVAMLIGAAELWRLMRRIKAKSDAAEA